MIYNAKNITHLAVSSKLKRSEPKKRTIAVIPPLQKHNTPGSISLTTSATVLATARLTNHNYSAYS